MKISTWEEQVWAKASWTWQLTYLQFSLYRFIFSPIDSPPDAFETENMQIFN